MLRTSVFFGVNGGSHRGDMKLMGDPGAGIVEIAGEDTDRNPDRLRDDLQPLRDLAVDTGVPITWGMLSDMATYEAVVIGAGMSGV
jgi:hypothetical protein